VKCIVRYVAVVYECLAKICFEIQIINFEKLSSPNTLYFCEQVCEDAHPSGRAVVRRRSAAARLVRLCVRIPPGAWMSVCCDCCMLSGRGVCDELITSPEESYLLWCVVVCGLETAWMRRPWPTGRGGGGGGCCARINKTKGCEATWLFFEARRGPRVKKVWETLVYTE
jgi:hypothetical protein